MFSRSITTCAHSHAGLPIVSTTRVLSITERIGHEELKNMVNIVNRHGVCDYRSTTDAKDFLGVVEMGTGRQIAYNAGEMVGGTVGVVLLGSPLLLYTQMMGTGSFLAGLGLYGVIRVLWFANQYTDLTKELMTLKLLVWDAMSDTHNEE